MLNICNSHLLYIRHLILKSCSVEYWPLLSYSVQDITSWRLVGRDIVSGCRGFVVVLVWLGFLFQRSSFRNGGKSLNEMKSGLS